MLAATPTSSLESVLGPEVEHVTALDTCIVRLWDGLHARWPSTAPDKAGLKLHLAVNVLDATPTKLKLGPEPGNEGTPWKRLWPETRAEKVERELMQTGRVLAWLWSHELTGRVLDLDAWLARRMTPQDPHRTLSCDYLMPVPGG